MFIRILTVAFVAGLFTLFVGLFGLPQKPSYPRVLPEHSFNAPTADDLADEAVAGFLNKAPKH